VNRSTRNSSRFACARLFVGVLIRPFPRVSARLRGALLHSPPPRPLDSRFSQRLASPYPTFPIYSVTRRSLARVDLTRTRQTK